MKASLVLTLFSLCLRVGAAELPHLGKALSFPKYSSILAAALDPKDGRVLNSVSKQNTSHPYLKIDFAHKRTGAGTIIHYGISMDKCIQICRKRVYNCLAVNYHRASRNCYELTTLGAVSSDANYATCLVNYKDGDDPCDDVYSIKRFSHEYFVYDRYSGADAPSAKDCCMKCRGDPQSRCKVWSYDTPAKLCWLQDEAPALSAISSRTTGLGVVDSSSEPTTS